MLKDELVKAIEENHMADAFLMLYFKDQVLIGKYDSTKPEKLILNPVNNEENVTEIHIFNKEKELRGRSVASLKVFTDTPVFLEEGMFLIGNKAVIDGDGSVVTQNGREVFLPFHIEFNDVPKNNLRIIVRHLFDDEGAIAGYRLVDIREVKKNEHSIY